MMFIKQIAQQFKVAQILSENLVYSYYDAQDAYQDIVRREPHNIKAQLALALNCCRFAEILKEGNELPAILELYVQASHYIGAAVRDAERVNFRLPRRFYEVWTQTVLFVAEHDMAHAELELLADLVNDYWSLGLAQRYPRLLMPLRHLVPARAVSLGHK